MSTFDLPEQSISQQKKVNRMKINLYNHILFKEIAIEVILENEIEKTPLVYYVKLEGQEYDNWGNDDNYILQTVASKLNISLS